jgi:hypothetical protein
LDADAILFVRAAVSAALVLGETNPTLTLVDARSGELLVQDRILTVGGGFRREPRERYLDLLVGRLRRMGVGAAGPKKKLGRRPATRATAVGDSLGPRVS